jgi:hypothetical protein
MEKRKYTVLGFFEDNGQRFSYHVTAKDWIEAEESVMRKSKKDGLSRSIVATINGHVIPADTAETIREAE